MKLKTKPSSPSSSGNCAHLVVAHAGGVPVERRREVVGQHLVRVDGVDRLGELAGVGEVRGLRLHPQQVRVRGGGQGLGDRVGDAAANLVVALRRLRAAPGPSGTSRPISARPSANRLPRRRRGERAPLVERHLRARHPRRRGRPSPLRRPRRCVVRPACACQTATKPIAAASRVSLGARRSARARPSSSIVAAQPSSLQPRVGGVRSCRRRSRTADGR